MVHGGYLIHWKHTNVIKYSNRPFSSIEEHDEILIQNWNKYVKKQDRIYHLGDFCLSNKTNTLNIRKRLNGQIHLIRGNHDKSAWQIRDTFESFSDIKQIIINDQELFLSHYAHITWNKAHCGCIHLFGHSHTSLNGWIERNIPDSRMLDTGVDGHDFFPWNFDEIIEYMKNKKGYFVDHHIPEEEDSC